MTVADNLAGITVEVGFGVDAVGGDYFLLDDPVKGELDNVTYLLAPDTVFVDVTDHVAAISTKRGRERELDEYTAGTATVVFNDNDRTFDPAYSASPYFGEIVPMKRIIIKWQDIDLFTGWVDDWSVMYERGDSLSRVTAECVDGFVILANQELNEIASAHTGDLSGVRITRILNRAEVAYPPTRSIDDGNSILGNTTLGGNALAYLQACARAEAGYLFVAADGTLTFRGRNVTLNKSVTGATFSDDRSAGIPYRNVTQRSTSDLLYTRVTGQTETVGNPLVAFDSVAADEFLIRTLSLGTLFTSSDVQTQNILDYHLERFSSVEVRLDSATLATATLTTDEVETVVSFDLTDLVTVERSPLGVGDPIERFSIVDGIRHNISPGSWITELNFANADTRTVFVLDDPDFGVLNANRLAF